MVVGGRRPRGQTGGVGDVPNGKAKKAKSKEEEESEDEDEGARYY